MNGLVGLAHRPASAFDDVAIMIRFNEMGFIDVRDGDDYRADAPVTYAPGASYAIRVEGDVARRSYSVFLEHSDGTETALARGYRFRTTQADVTSLGHWVVWNDDGDDLTHCGLTVDGDATCGDGLVSEGEVCDDGNHEDGDCCNADCTARAETTRVCRPAADACDEEETCSAEGMCPPDVRRSGEECGFLHPGVLMAQTELDTLRENVAAGREPWNSAFIRARDHAVGSPTYTPTPFSVVECGSFNMPNVGCDEEIRDAAAAYTQALLWGITGDPAYATNSIRILNAWSRTLTAHTNSNAPLMTAWAASIFTRAAELMRHTTSGMWEPADVARFEAMLRDVFLPEIINGTFPLGGPLGWWTNGNWELSMIEGVIGIGVFLDDLETFEAGVAMWRRRVPAYIYLSTDGPTPVMPPGAEPTSYDQDRLWRTDRFLNGMTQETCRDLGHVALGFASMANAAHTASIHGVDLFAEERDRITAAFEFHAQYLNGASVPADLCEGSLVFLRGSDATYEVGYRALKAHGSSLPETETYLRSIRPTGLWIAQVWETLTHGTPL